METKGKVAGKFTLSLPKDGSGPDNWEIQLKDIEEDVYVMVSRIMRKEGKELEAMKLLIKNLYIGGDSISDVLKDWKAVYASAEEIMSILPSAQGVLKKN